jgi:hypothetical protein
MALPDKSKRLPVRRDSLRKRKGVLNMPRVPALLLGWLAIFGAPLAFGQNPKIIEAAKKEGGKVILYTSMETFTADALKKAFESKTGLQMDYWRGGSTEVIDRVLSEHRVGKPIFDVVATTGDHMHLMFKEGAFSQYRLLSKDSPKTLSIRAWAHVIATSCTALFITRVA